MHDRRFPDSGYHEFPDERSIFGDVAMLGLGFLIGLFVLHPVKWPRFLYKKP